MNKPDVVRAWKDAIYRTHLSLEQQADLPEHPAGSIELDDRDLDQVQGGLEGTHACLTAGCCNTYYYCDTGGYVCMGTFLIVCFYKQYPIF